MERPLRDRISRTYRRFWTSETAVMLIMALLVGLASGFGAVAFRRLVDATHALFFDTLGARFANLPLPRPLALSLTILIPALGGLIVGILGHRLVPEVRGPGVSNVIEALSLRGGRIRPAVVAAKPLATSLTIGTGGSAGREGPIVQIGSAIGSTLSQIARLSDERTKNLVACGAAGGIAATFNAPLAGVMFAIEVLLAEFGLVQFTGVVVAAVAASMVSHAYIGDVPAFPFPPTTPFETWELPAYVLLGVCAAFVGVGFTRVLYAVDEFFEERPWPPYLKPALGGLLVGIVGFWFPRVLGIGYDSVEAVLFNRLAIAPIVILGLLKVVVTAFTIGSGGSGGIFAPCLFVGAMLGGLSGKLVHQMAPGAPWPASYALVGMSAVFAAASRAPITAVLTIFEMTRDYTIILPLMLTTVVSAFIARLLLKDSIYTVKLTRRGIDPYAGRHLDLMGAILVGQAMTAAKDATTVQPSTPLTELARIFDESHHHGAIVVDDKGHLKGVVTITDLEHAPPQQLVTGTVADIQTSNVRTVFPDQSLKDALHHLGALDAGRIPVVDRAYPSRVVGVLRRGDILRAYSHAALDQQARIVQLERASLEGRTGMGSRVSSAATSTVEVRLQGHHGAVGKTLQELDLPPESLIASVRRGDRVLIPRGDTRLQAGDVVVALVTPEGKQQLESRLVGSSHRL